MLDGMRDPMLMGSAKWACKETRLERVAALMRLQSQRLGPYEHGGVTHAEKRRMGNVSRAHIEAHAKSATPRVRTLRGGGLDPAAARARRRRCPGTPMVCVELCPHAARVGLPRPPRVGRWN
eukprot:1951275-Prymnesium_polylepis.1